MVAMNFSTFKLASLTTAAIEAAVVKKADDGFRQHLGASLIGKSCQRSLWYSFRWVRKANFDGRMLRLFERGQKEEPAMAGLLRGAGIQVIQVDPSTGRQYVFSHHGGHFGGSMDGALYAIPDAPKTWHVWECKTSGKKAFDNMVEKGVKLAKPEHYAQMQCYMHWTGMTRALYTMVCKDDDRLHLERIDYDKEFAESLMSKAETVIFAATPPAPIGGKDWWECKFCDNFAVCHEGEVPEVNCRTCAHSTPERAGYWSCARNGSNEIPVQFQKQGCDQHRYIPILLEPANQCLGGSDSDNWVKYRHCATGAEFVNGNPPDGFLSREIKAASSDGTIPFLAKNEFVVELRQQFGAEVVG